MTRNEVCKVHWEMGQRYFWELTLLSATPNLMLVHSMLNLELGPHQPPEAAFLSGFLTAFKVWMQSEINSRQYQNWLAKNVSFQDLQGNSHVRAEALYLG